MTWADEVQLIHTEAAGVLRLDIVQPGDLSDLVGAAMFGDQHSQCLMGAVEQVLQGIASAPRRAPRLCACCPRPIRKHGEFSIIVASPERDGIERALTLAVCSRCATEREAVRGKAIIALQRLWPSARPIAVHQQGGHA